VTDELPTFRGSDSALADYIDKNFAYSRRIKDEGIKSEKIRIGFIVTREGKLRMDTLIPNYVFDLFAREAEIRTGEKQDAFETELVNVLEHMPDWNPAILHGKAVNFYCLLDVYIDLGILSGNKHVSITNLSGMYNLNIAMAEEAYNSGVRKSQEQDYKGAAADFSETLKYRPTNIDALYNRGAMKFRMKDTAGACTDWHCAALLGDKESGKLLEKYCNMKADSGGPVETFPQFPGGDDALYKYLRRNLNYPEEARRNHVEGKVKVTFVVDREGKIRDAKILEGIGYGCNEEALRLINEMPDWKPGTQNGKPVQVQYYLPILFSQR
jgi:TonB family protein